jgi:hypothetical protein
MRVQLVSLQAISGNIVASLFAILRVAKSSASRQLIATLSHFKPQR